MPQVGQNAESAVNAEPHFVQNTLNTLRSYSPLSHTKFSTGNDPPAAASLLAALAQKFVQPPLRLRVALARRGSQQNSCLVAISGDAFAAPVQLCKRNLRFGISFLHGNPQQPHCFLKPAFTISALEDVLSLRVFLFSGFGLRLSGRLLRRRLVRRRSGRSCARALRFRRIRRSSRRVARFFCCRS